MERMPRLLALAAATLALSGCSLQTIALETAPGRPSTYELDDPFSGDPAAFWSADRSTFDVVAFGSSTCVPVPTKLEVTSPSSLALTFVTPRGSCAEDSSSTTYTFETPDGVTDAIVELSIAIGDETYSMAITEP